MSILGSGHIRAEVRPVPRRALVFVFAIVLLIAWGVVDPALWWLGVSAGVLASIGMCQMIGWVPSI
ncbi:MAG: hypothetical protein L3K16_06215 [Thermoplasmata archaeon]|nr:hypothetical protein [Thermoplasmata archaeon]